MHEKYTLRVAPFMFPAQSTQTTGERNVHIRPSYFLSRCAIFFMVRILPPPPEGRGGTSVTVLTVLEESDLAALWLEEPHSTSPPVQAQPSLGCCVTLRHEH